MPGRWRPASDWMTARPEGLGTRPGRGVRAKREREEESEGRAGRGGTAEAAESST